MKLNLIRIIVLLITPILCAAMLTLCCCEARGQSVTIPPRTVQVEAPFCPDAVVKIKAALPKEWRVLEKTADNIAAGRDLPVDFILLWDQREEDGQGILVAFTLKRVPSGSSCPTVYITEFFRSDVTEISEAIKRLAKVVDTEHGESSVAYSQTKTLTIDFWTSEENEQILREAFKVNGYEVKSYPRKLDDPLVIVGREYLHCENQENGLVILVVDKVKPTCGPNGEIQFELVWQSKPATPTEAVRQWLKEVQR